MGIKDFIGRWRIYEMELWEQEDVDEDVKAYIEIGKDRGGHFQFLYVHGEIDARVVKFPDFERLEFTWDGNDECDPASGSGWLRLTGKSEAEGEIKFHMGNVSRLKARRWNVAGRG